jgi:acyl-CoA thioesterase-1
MVLPARNGRVKSIVNGWTAVSAVTVTLFVASSGSVAAEPFVLLALGDSLVAGYGLPDRDGFTSVLESELVDAGYDVTVLNAGVSGDTTAGGVARLDWALADDPDAVLIELGANDMLRGLDPAEARTNLETILSRLQADDIPALLAGMLASPNWGPEYQAEFDAMYPELAEMYDVPLYPFFLEGVAADATLNQSDGIHPNRNGVDIIVDNILPYVMALIDDHRSDGG